MTARPPHDVRRASIRVALGTTAAVAVIYLLVAAAVVVIVTANLTGQVDDRLATALAAPQPTDAADGDPPEGPHDRPLGTPVLTWLVRGDGTVLTSAASTLPAGARDVIRPATVTIAGTPIRVAGADTATGHLVVGQDMTDVQHAQSTTMLAELIIGPILLIIVFGGSVFIGRRVATPIEIARQRQLDFSADASHELRTPLAVIEAHASLALSEPRTPEWYRTAFEQVSGESHRMRGLVDDLLWLARFDANHRRPTAEPVDVGVLAAQAVDRFRPLAEAKGLSLAADVVDEQAVAAPADWLDRLLGVLLDNACKYAPPGGEVRVGVKADGSRVEVTVDDSGPGIPESERERIFNRFHRAEERGSGSGLGLAIADEIVRATNGRWHLDRSPQGGARMTVSWPRGHERRG
jgi:signal transduction histidine kinase